MKNSVLACLFTFISLSTYAKIQVQGVGEIEIIPNRARLSFSIITKDKDSKIASDNNAKISKTVTSKIIEEMNLNKKNIKTSNYSLRPIYTYINNKPPKLEGMEVSNDFQVSDIQIEKASDLINLLSNQKISEIRNIEFYHNDMEKFDEACLTKAVENAKKKAQILADQSNLKIVGIKEIFENIQANNSPVPVMFKAHAEGISSNVHSGSLEIQKTINVIFETK